MNDDVDTLVQRFLDNELSREERRTLLRRLAQDRELERRLLATEAMLDAVAALPRPEPSHAFVGRTIAALPLVEVAPAAPRPRSSAFALRFAATLAAAGVLLALGFFAGRVQAPPTSGQTPTFAAAPREVLVRLVLIDPHARTVHLVGDFNDWSTTDTPLVRGANGAWSTTIPLRPGRYHYMFVVDGDRWVADPLANETSLDGFGGQDSVLDVEV
jgi:hypothetical protein